MSNQSLRAAALIFFFAAASTVAAFGQDGIRADENDCQKRQEKLVKELMRATLDYWSPRFTAYQALIDKTLSKEDLQDLNQLRGRFRLAIKTVKEAQLRLNQRYSAEREADMRSMRHSADGRTLDELHSEDQMDRNYAISVDSAAAAANAEVDSVAAAVAHFVNDSIDTAVSGAVDSTAAAAYAAVDSVAAAASGENASVAAAAYAAADSAYAAASGESDSAAAAVKDSLHAAAYATIDSAGSAREAAIGATARAAYDTIDSVAHAGEAPVEASAEGDGAATPSEESVHISIRHEEELVDPDRKAEESASKDLETINQTAMELAERYESRLQELDGRMKNDIMEFLLIAAGKMRDFGAKNDMEMCESANFMIDQVVTMETDSIRRNAANDFLEKIGGTQANAIVMLVGNDVAGVLKTMMQGEAGDFSNILPRRESTPALSSAMLEQNAPNPAAISTEIAYTLPEPSSATVITLYGTDGKVAVAYDQGPRPAGRQVAKIDVGALTPGAYIYRLKISTSAGDQVFSKTMQVVR